MDIEKFGKYGMDLIKLNERVVFSFKIINNCLEKIHRQSWKRKEAAIEEIGSTWGKAEIKPRSWRIRYQAQASVHFEKTKAGWIKFGVCVERKRRGVKIEAWAKKIKTRRPQEGCWIAQEIGNQQKACYTVERKRAWRECEAP